MGRFRWGLESYPFPLRRRACPGEDPEGSRRDPVEERAGGKSDPLSGHFANSFIIVSEYNTHPHLLFRENVRQPVRSILPHPLKRELIDPEPFRLHLVTLRGIAHPCDSVKKVHNLIPRRTRRKQECQLTHIQEILLHGLYTRFLFKFPHRCRLQCFAPLDLAPNAGNFACAEAFFLQPKENLGRHISPNEKADCSVPHYCSPIGWMPNPPTNKSKLDFSIAGGTSCPDYRGGKPLPHLLKFPSSKLSVEPPNTFSPCQLNTITTLPPASPNLMRNALLQKIEGARRRRRSMRRDGPPEPVHPACGPSPDRRARNRLWESRARRMLPRRSC